MQTRYSPGLQTCPHCGSGEVHMTVCDGLLERCVIYLWGISPFQCRCCCKRFYRRIVAQEEANPKIA